VECLTPEAWTSIFAKSIILKAKNNYRVILKMDGEEIEIGSIGIQSTTGASSVWHWGNRYRDPDAGTGFGRRRSRPQRFDEAVQGRMAAVL
jgi:hypothetical protein